MTRTEAQASIAELVAARDTQRGMPATPAEFAAAVMRRCVDIYVAEQAEATATP